MYNLLPEKTINDFFYFYCAFTDELQSRGNEYNACSVVALEPLSCLKSSTYRWNLEILVLFLIYFEL